jgi:3-methylfumaryl-CoA hydratase
MNTESARLEDWVGSRESTVDIVTAAKVEAMAATLDRDDPPPREGDPLPPLWHWMFHAPIARHSALGPDGHPARGGFMPPVPLPRRMFAGGRMKFLRPVGVGETITREGEVISVSPKRGRTGELVFVTVRYVISTDAGPAIEEEQDIVYREDRSTAATTVPEPADIDDMPWRRKIAPDAVMLFRYSALTFNGHRIHYDHPYVTEVEGYPGLVVHGPLIATCLAELCRDQSGRALASFAFRARSPIFTPSAFTVAGGPDADGAGCAVVAVGPDGEAAMTAGASFADS